MKKTFLLLLLVTAFLGCNRDDDDALSGNINTMTARVNGRSFVSDFVGIGFSDNTDIGLEQGFKSLTMNAQANETINTIVPRNLLLVLFIDEATEASNPPLTLDVNEECLADNGYCLLMQYLNTETEEGLEWDAGITENSTIDVQLEQIDLRIGGRVSGTFSGTIASNNDTTQVFVVEDGRFDVVIE